MGSRFGMEDLEKRKISCLYLDSNPERCSQWPSRCL